MKNKQRIAAEIEKLKALKPVGAHARATQRKIELAIEELEHGVDDTADEWWELTDSERDIVLQARFWKDDDSYDRPSQGWGSLVAK